LKKLALFCFLTAISGLLCAQNTARQPATVPPASAQEPETLLETARVSYGQAARFVGVGVAWP